MMRCRQDTRNACDSGNAGVFLHLGLVTAGDDRCFIEVDGERYSWRDGQSALFDETYIHRVGNNTDCNRIVLFCDVERPMKYRWAQAVNRFVGARLVTGASPPQPRGGQDGPHQQAVQIRLVCGAVPPAVQEPEQAGLHECVKFSLIAGVIVPIVLV